MLRDRIKETTTYIPSVEVPHIRLVDEFPIVRQLGIDCAEPQLGKPRLAMENPLRLVFPVMFPDRVFIIDRDLHR